MIAVDMHYFTLLEVYAVDYCWEYNRYEDMKK
jgi:hypothetical protein